MEYSLYGNGKEVFFFGSIIKSFFRCFSLPSSLLSPLINCPLNLIEFFKRKKWVLDLILHGRWYKGLPARSTPYLEVRGHLGIPLNGLTALQE